MLSFKKYNCTGTYETFVYYREYNEYYIQFMYAGNKGEEPDILSETFHTNLHELHSNDSNELYSNESKIIFINLVNDCEKDSSTPIYILKTLKNSMTRFIQ